MGGEDFPSVPLLGGLGCGLLGGDFASDVPSCGGAGFVLAGSGAAFTSGAGDFASGGPASTGPGCFAFESAVVEVAKPFTKLPLPPMAAAPLPMMPVSPPEADAEAALPCRLRVDGQRQA